MKTILPGICAVLVSVACSTPGIRDANAVEEGPTISGRIEDPHGLRPRDAVLMVGSQEQSSYGFRPIEIKAGERFVTPPLSSGTYVLRLTRPPQSVTDAPMLGLAVVAVKATDVTGVTITVQRDVSVTGVFRMESDNPAALWPPHLVVLAPLIAAGTAVHDGAVGDGMPGGRFVLRNPIGPRVIRTGYSLAPGHAWWPSRVLLNGEDVTNVPTDFSRHEDAKLEVVFTQHPARLVGIVENADGRAIPDAWVIVCTADPQSCVSWATTSQVVRADAKGAFRIATVPGRYIARAFSPAAFSSREAALGRLDEVAPGATAVTLDEREVERLRLVVK